MLSREKIREIRRIEIRSKRAVSDLFAGRYHSVFKGQGMEFQEVREYSPGDDIRAIDWNVTARHGTPFVKVFREERELTVMLLVDVSASTRYASGSQSKRETSAGAFVSDRLVLSLNSAARLKLDIAAEVAAVLAFSAISNHDRVGLILFSDRVEKFLPPAKGTPHILRIISEILDTTPASPRTDIAPALEYLNRVIRRRSVAFLLTDFVAPPCDNLLRVTARRHDLVAIGISDPAEFALPDAGFVDFHDPETGRRVLVDTSYAPARRAWAARQSAWRDDLLHTLRSASVDCMEITAGEPYTRELVRFFRTREKRR